MICAGRIIAGVNLFGIIWTCLQTEPELLPLLAACCGFACTVKCCFEDDK